MRFEKHRRIPQTLRDLRAYVGRQRVQNERVVHARYRGTYGAA